LCKERARHRWQCSKTHIGKEGLARGVARATEARRDRWTAIVLWVIAALLIWIVWLIA